LPVLLLLPSPAHILRYLAPLPARYYFAVAVERSRGVKEVQPVSLKNEKATSRPEKCSIAGIYVATMPSPLPA